MCYGEIGLIVEEEKLAPKTTHHTPISTVNDLAGKYFLMIKLYQQAARLIMPPPPRILKGCSPIRGRNFPPRFSESRGVRGNFIAHPRAVSYQRSTPKFCLINSEMSWRFPMPSLGPKLTEFTARNYKINCRPATRAQLSKYS